ncbi:MAG: short-chain dehydrogenase [Mycobacterium sp.]|jgi:NAD(P)-dependent dehydrogenase (short-subunit alcohol dehydrogenase family)|nr:short-chain dehydrogenase [Mycobacterium sp.]
MRTHNGRIALVTGASKGVGAEVARQLASTGTHVVVNHHQDTQRADAVVSSICTAGAHASTWAADIFDEADTTAMIDAIGDRFGRLDTMVLTAGGGLDAAVNPGYAMRRNRDAHRRLALSALPLMPAGGRILFVTSHQAHFFPDKAVPKGYAATAASLRAGETALYSLRSEFARAGIGFTVVSGDMLDGFATTVVDSATSVNPPGIVYVGRADYLMTA